MFWNFRHTLLLFLALSVPFFKRQVDLSWKFGNCWNWSPSCCRLNSNLISSAQWSIRAFYFRKATFYNQWPAPISSLCRVGVSIKQTHQVGTDRLLRENASRKTMKSLVVLSIVMAAVATTCQAQIISFGQCAVPEVVVNFDVAAYLGKWYEIERYEQVFQRNGECVTATYSINEDGSVRVENAMLVPPSGKFDIDIGRALLSFPDELPLQAKLNVSFGGMRECWRFRW